ncbi:hypothetical protein [Streptomyces cinereoruber]|uniref:hypothetical protein n=1 Tax=Streptomyces cinereoruber TaxID=67260 RepID=UPI003642E7D3
MWVLTPADRVVATKAAADLDTAVLTPQAQQALPEVDQLAHLREALAAVAIALAHVHGRLAWFPGHPLTGRPGAGPSELTGPFSKGP